jgi:hypothetical protein
MSLGTDLNPRTLMAEPSMTPVRAVDLGNYELTIATQAGPRLVGFRRKSGPQLFADLADLMLEHPGIPDYALLGGHRLWRAPEIPSLTYLPDDTPVTIELNAGSVTVQGAPETDGLVKRFTTSSNGDHVTVDHELRNAGSEPIDCAPWAITQMVPGGIAVLPQNHRLADPVGVQPNRSVVLWPYTDPGAPDITWGREAILIAGSSDPAPLKVGQRNDRGWVAYAASGELFVKWTGPDDPTRTYLDLDATIQVYRNDKFVELETLGPPQLVAPGESLNHRETWAIYQIGDVDTAGLLAAVATLDLPITPEPG